MRFFMEKTLSAKTNLWKRAHVPSCYEINDFFASPQRKQGMIRPLLARRAGSLCCGLKD
jgi:hypothetical protein